MMNYPSLIKRLVNWLRHQVKDAHARGAVVGISGGLDSAVTARLCQRALGKNVLGLMLPCESSPTDARDARLIARRFKIKTRTVDLTRIYKNLVRLLPQSAIRNPQSEIQGRVKALANLKPRLRMLVLYYFANKLNYLVVGTGNKSELMTGYFTKFGDGGVDILPLGGLLKTEVRPLAGYLRIPQRIIDKPPSAGLWPGQTDEGELGIAYPELDTLIGSNLKSLTLNLKPETLNLKPQLTARVRRLIQSSAHKRHPPEIFVPPVPHRPFLLGRSPASSVGCRRGIPKRRQVRRRDELKQMPIAVRLV